MKEASEITSVSAAADVFVHEEENTYAEPILPASLSIFLLRHVIVPRLREKSTPRAESEGSREERERELDPIVAEESKRVLGDREGSDIRSLSQLIEGLGKISS